MNKLVLTILLFQAFIPMTNLMAQVSLGFDGNYGDKAGCDLALKGISPQTDASTFLNSTRYSGHEQYCEFSWGREIKRIGENDYRLWSAVSVCNIEGEYTSELITIQKYLDRVIITSGSKASEAAELKRCK